MKNRSCRTCHSSLKVVVLSCVYAFISGGFMMFPLDMMGKMKWSSALHENRV